eukprot:SAG31_NODE_4951_length_2837_cov_6.891892_2_plen_77_part_00
MGGLGPQLTGQGLALLTMGSRVARRTQSVRMWSHAPVSRFQLAVEVALHPGQRPGWAATYVQCDFFLANGKPTSDS